MFDHAMPTLSGFNGTKEQELEFRAFCSGDYAARQLAYILRYLRGEIKLFEHINEYCLNLIISINGENKND